MPANTSLLTLLAQRHPIIWDIINQGGLEERGIISRKVHSLVPRRVEYSLTDRGRALLPILAEIVRWGASGAHEGMGSTGP